MVFFLLEKTKNNKSCLKILINKISNRGESKVKDETYKNYKFN